MPSRNAINYRTELRQTPASARHLTSNVLSETFIEQCVLLGQYELRDIASMDQTPLPFVLNGGKEYETQGDKTVWHRGRASGLDKWQCTAQLTIFADGVPRVKPLLIYIYSSKIK